LCYETRGYETRGTLFRLVSIFDYRQRFERVTERSVKELLTVSFVEISGTEHHNSPQVSWLCTKV
jgi:hypothetical protein